MIVICFGVPALLGFFTHISHQENSNNIAAESIPSEQENMVARWKGVHGLNLSVLFFVCKRSVVGNCLMSHALLMDLAWMFVGYTVGVRDVNSRFWVFGSVLCSKRGIFFERWTKGF